MQMSLKKGGADRDLHKALHYMLLPEDELQQVAKESQSFGQWLGDYIEYRRRPTVLTPFEYRLMSQPTEIKVQQVLRKHCLCFTLSKAEQISCRMLNISADTETW